MFTGKPEGIPPMVGNINGIPLSTEPGPQRLSKPPFILNEQDPHRATMPHPPTAAGPKPQQEARRPGRAGSRAKGTVGSGKAGSRAKEARWESGRAGTAAKGTVGVRGARPPG